MGYCIVALMVLLGTPDAAAASEIPVGYEVRVVEMKGLEWRGEVYSDLKPVARQRGASVWLAPRAAVSKLLGQAAREVYTPKPATGRDVPADIRTTLCYPYVAYLERRADGAFGNATAVGYLPHIEQVEESLTVGVSCRKSETGVRTEVSIEETRLAMLTSYEIGELVQPSEPSPSAEATEIKAPIQVPEIIHGEVKGEWYIPEDHVLVVGLGIHTTQDRRGKSSILERVAIIDPKAAPASAAPTRDPAAGQKPMAAMPRFPLETLPPRDPAARAVALPASSLPPLPIAESGRWITHLDANRVPVPLPPPVIPVATVPAAGAVSSSSPLIVSSQDGGPLVVIVPVGGPVNVAPASTLTPVAMAPIIPVHPAAPVARRAPVEPLGTPILPDRSLPTPRNALGQVVPLPPLPEPEPEVVDSTAEPRGSAQDRHVKPAPADDVYQEIVPAPSVSDGAHASLSRRAAGGCCELTPLEALKTGIDGEMRRASATLGAAPSAVCAAAASPKVLPTECAADGCAERKFEGRFTLSLSSEAAPSAEVDGEWRRLRLPIGGFLVLGIETKPKPR
jgi:hypothetical protein